MRRATLALALAPLVAGPAASALAAGSGATPVPATTQQAPDADSHATAVQLDDLLKIGDTSSHAGSGGGSSNADALDIGGETPIDGQNRGSPPRPGCGPGAVADTRAPPPGAPAPAPRG